LQSTTKRRLRLILLPLSFLAALVLTAYVLVHLLLPPGRATGDPLDIRLVGAYTSSSTDLHDASGKVIGDTLAAADWSERTVAAEEAFPRYFVFRLQDTPEDIVLCGDLRPGAFDACDGLRLHLAKEIKPLRVFQPVPFIARWHWQAPVTQIDLAVSYWYGRRGPASLTFTGPFKPGTTVSPGGGAVGTLIIASYFNVSNVWGTWCWLSGNAPMSVHEVLAYDLSGKRRRVRYSLVGGGQTMGHALFVVPELAPHEISAITFSEMPRTKTFHNVTVAYGGPARPGAPGYLDKLRERLNVRTGSLSDAFDAPGGYLKAIDLVRGMHILRACRAIEPIAGETWYAALPSADRDRLRNALTAWVSADDPRIRSAGACLGVKIDFRGFVNAAIDLLGCSDDDARAMAARALVENASKLSDDDVLRLTDAALNGLGPEHNKSLVLEAITSSRAGAVPDALSRLARDPRPWLWWPALRDERCPESAGPVDALQPQLRDRRLIASGFDPAIVSRRAPASDARTLLPALVTPEFEDRDPVAFAAVFELMVAQCGRAAAERAIWSFLTSAKDYARAGKALGLMVKYINLWHGVNIAGLGSDVKAGLPHANLYGWREIVLDVLNWRDTGQIRPEIPPGYKVTKGDVRIILMKDGQPEAAGISLWVAPNSPAVVGGVRTVKAGSGFLAYSIEPGYGPYSGRINGPPGPGRHDLAYEFQCEGSEASTYERAYFETSGGGVYPLPQVDDRQPGWKIVIERADSLESVLSGTKVFSDWWDKYGASSADSTAPMPARVVDESPARSQGTP